MKMRIAKKICNTRVPDPERKPSEQTPYSDHQWLAAARRYRKGLLAWKRVDPTMRTTPKWSPRYVPPTEDR